jgi:hypothetical protein
MSDKEEHRRRREQEHEESVLKTMDDIRFFRARNIDVELQPGNDDVREHLILSTQPSGAPEVTEVTERVNRLDQLEKTEEGRAVIRDALMRLELEEPIEEGYWE